MKNNNQLHYKTFNIIYFSFFILVFLLTIYLQSLLCYCDESTTAPPIVVEMFGEAVGRQYVIVMGLEATPQECVDFLYKFLGKEYFASLIEMRNEFGPDQEMDYLKDVFSVAKRSFGFATHTPLEKARILYAMANFKPFN